MAGTIVVDRIESDASYASTINVAGQITFSNTVNFGAFAGTAPVAGFYLPTTNNLAFTTASTERMRIDSSGNVGIGTSSPTNYANQRTLAVNGTTYGRIDLMAGGTVYGSLYGGTSGPTLSTGSALPVMFETNGTERMRIDSTGSLRIGNTGSGGTGPNGVGKFILNSDGYNMFMGGRFIGGDNASTYFTIGNWGDNSSEMRISTRGFTSFLTGSTSESNGTERMRINSSGSLLIGQTAQTSAEYLGITISAANQFAYWRSTGTSSNPTMFRMSTGIFSGTLGSGNFIYCEDGGSPKFYVVGGGSIYSTNTSISAISDRRLKQNIRDLETGLAEIMALKPRRFDWKEGEGTGAKDVAGFIAQEVETVLPDLVGDWKHNPNEESIYKSLQTGNMIPTLVKAIQEQQALITSLTARITALESN